ncbi:hypothetical protein BREVUG8_60025 [Brevundimonas sp. G8]|nr:hypothetical protein BREVUG8_60025 [Brevundimonas sp. G8]
MIAGAAGVVTTGAGVEAVAGAVFNWLVLAAVAAGAA